jgi:ribonuclease P protein component
MRNRLKRKVREVFRQHQVRELSLDILVYPSIPSSDPINISQQIVFGLDKIVKIVSGKK